MSRALLADLRALVPGVSERLACRWLGWCRAVVRYRPAARHRDARLAAILPLLARRQPRFGYRRLHDTVLRTVEHVCRDTIQRLCRTLDLQVKPQKRFRRRRPALEVVKGLRATAPHQVWCLDFLKDQTRDRRAVRFLSVVDEHTRRCLSLTVRRRYLAVDVVAVLARLVALHGTPGHVRSDNGPEFVAEAVETWARLTGIRLVRSAPASPWENPFSETIHSRMRDEFIEREDFGSLEEAQVLAESYRVWYNDERPHSALKYQTPNAFAAKVMGMGLVTGQPGLAEAIG